jgi:hypothetical protein
MEFALSVGVWERHELEDHLVLVTGGLESDWFENRLVSTGVERLAIPELLKLERASLVGPNGLVILGEQEHGREIVAEARRPWEAGHASPDLRQGDGSVETRRICCLRHGLEQPGALALDLGLADPLPPSVDP